MPDFNIVAVSGSLRAASFNTSALRAADELKPDGVMITMTNISAVPIFNQDVLDRGLPASVVALVNQIANADAVMIATPEYNYLIPGVLKNAIDRVSKAPDQPFKGKPVAIMGASPGGIGTARSQYDLRKVFVSLNAYVLNQPEIMISAAHTRFDASGKLTDEATRTLIASRLSNCATGPSVWGAKSKNALRIGQTHVLR